MLLATASAFGQAAPSAVTGPSISRVDIYAGYAYFHPFSSDINNIIYKPINDGAVASVSGYFNKYVGIQVEGSASPKSLNDTDCIFSAQGGIILRDQKSRFVPFVHALGGESEHSGPSAQTCHQWGWGITGGGGVDYILPFFHDHLALRPIQADFTYDHIDNGPLVLPGGNLGGLGKITSYRLSGGLVLRFGNMHGGPSPTLTCAATPAEVYPGDPVALTNTAMNLGRMKDVKYIWTSTSGPVGGPDTALAIDTATVVPGSYTATVRIVVGKKQVQVASCAADFKVLDTEPPVISCAANRSSIHSGEAVTVTSTARSPQNLGLTYSYSTTNGQIVGDGANATLSTTGVTPGSITVTCGVVDCKGKTASATTSVVVATPPPPPPAPEARSLCGVSFDRDTRRPVRVDNEAKGCLDDIALTMNREVGDKLLIIGNRASGESSQNAGARALNVSEYLIKEKGIDPSRLELREGSEPSRTVTNTLIPPGASVDAGTATSFDGTKIRNRGQAYGTPGVHAPVHRSTTKKSASTSKATAAQFKQQ